MNVPACEESAVALTGEGTRFFLFLSATTVLAFVVRLIKAFIVADIVYLLFMKARIPGLRPRNRLNMHAARRQL